jgi:cyclopropane-fatty-acyl-phospholipid synthase
MSSAYSAEDKIEKILEIADVRTDRDRPWDITVHDERFFTAVLAHRALGFGESYMEGWWDCEDLAQLFDRVLGAHLQENVPIDWTMVVTYLKARFENRQAKPRATNNVHRHYDIGNDLYRSMLGRWMLYSAANWQSASCLDEAGEAKLEFVCQRLNLQAGDRVLDIGCGWGGFEKYAATKYGVQVTGITLSPEQASVARESCGDLPVEIRLQDYRELDGAFDHVVSLGMFEHVGYKNYRRYMEIVRRCLMPGGVFFLNTIGTHRAGCCVNPWTDKYIFPGGVLPSISQIGDAVEDLFVVDELQDWREFYDKTLMVWFDNFHANWNKLKSHYSEKFYRMWKYYLLSSAGAFRSKAIQDWEIVLSG